MSKKRHRSLSSSKPPFYHHLQPLHSSHTVPTILTRQEQLVFVDPQDLSALFWLPAVAIPPIEWSLFFSCMAKERMQFKSLREIENKHQNDEENDCVLVCFFDDASFAMVPPTFIKPFRPRLDPFKQYSQELGTRILNILFKGEFFTEDPAVKAACHYWSTGEPPRAFKWLSKRIIKQQQQQQQQQQQSSKQFSLIKNFTNKSKKASDSEKIIQRSKILQKWISAFEN